MIRSLALRLPRPLRELIRSARSHYRSIRYRLRERFRPTSLSQADVEAALRECGLEEGDTAFLQAAMSAFGSFESGPATVVDALEAVVGPDGVIAMPAYPLTEPAIEHLAADPVFDVRSTPSRMGAVSEAFRRRDGTRRSIHPTHPTAAWGAGADAVVAGHESAATPFGEGTPFPRIVERNALQLYFGCGTGPMTMYHAFECMRVPAFPLDVFATDVAFDGRCLDWDGRELKVRTLVHSPELLPVRIDSNARLQGVFREAILAGGGRSVRLGKGEILAIRLPDLMALFERLIGEGVTIYDRALPAEPPVLPPQDRAHGG